MKKIYDFGLAFLLIGFCTFAASAQITCKDSITVALTQFDPMAEIFVADIIIGSNTGDISLDRSQFDCDDIFEAIVVTASRGDDKCTTKVRVVDVYAPVAIAETSVTIEIPKGFNTLLLNPQVLDDGSYDECSAIEFALAPSIISCLDAGKMLDVTMTVTDASGNSNFVITEVSVKPIDHAPVECVEDFEIAIVDQYFVSTKNIVDGENECTSADLQLINEADGSAEDRTLTLDDVGKTIVAEVTQLEDNSTCSTRITVVALECEPFIVCDTKCNSSDFGDCDSGHTEDDNIEWPCDLLIAGEYPGMTVSPMDLVNSFDVPEKDSEPQVAEGDCHVVGMTYQDQVSYIDNTVKVVREWIVLEWRTGYDASYVQEILFQSGGNTLVWNICDFEDNTTELGDCTSGHTESDDVEWPADVSALDHRILPNELLNISKVDFVNVRPVILANEEHYELSFEDAVISSTASFSVVSRKWTIQSKQSSELSADYVQYITVPEVEHAGNKIFVTTHGGRPMPGVAINDNYLTNESGVAIIEGDEFESLAYEDDDLEGLDILDEILIYQHILGQITLPIRVRPSMDINGDGKISTVDILYLNKLILGKDIPADVKVGWSFLERPTPLINVKADFIASKKGDVDDSAFLKVEIEDENTETLLIEDQLLNAGESYSVSMNFRNDQLVLGGQFFYEIDRNVVEIDSVHSSLKEASIDWSLNEEGILAITIRGEADSALKVNDAFLEVSLRAKSNSTLEKVLKLSRDREVFLVSTDLQKIYIDLDIEGQISSSTNEVNRIHDYRITPNPASTLVRAEHDLIGEINYEVFNTQGVRVLVSKEQEIDISQLPDGVYFLIGSNGKSRFSDRFIKL